MMYASMVIAHLMPQHLHCYIQVSDTFVQVSAIRMDTFETVTREVVISITEGKINSSLCNSKLLNLQGNTCRT